jgi:hypothetical protein
MRLGTTKSLLAIFAVLALVVGAIVWALSTAPTPHSLVSSAASEARAAVTSSSNPTHSAEPSTPGGVVLPNPVLTPGMASADVTPATIGSTICVAGYTAGRRHDDGRTVRPPESYTEALKRQQIAQYGYSDTHVADFEEDHLIPLELGGDGYAAANLWPEPYAGTGARVKDKLENRLKVLVCDGQLELRAAQQAIATNWYAAYQRYVLGQ